MKKILLLFPILFLIYWGCEEEQPEAESDTTPPLLFVTSHESGQSISEVITITAVSEDDRGVSRLEFYLNNILAVTDTTSPYEFQINTTQYDNDQLLVIKVKSYDYAENMARVVINLVVDNSVAVPLGGNITSVTYNLDSMTVEWLASTDGDFRDYKVLHSSIDVGARDTLATYTDISITSHTITEFDPTQDNWFWIQVTDTLGLYSIGTGMTNILESEPNPVNVTSVIYDLESMTITWEEYVPNMSRINHMNQSTRSTVTNDFVSYELLQSDSQYGNYLSVVVITDQSTTSYSLTEFDPTVENWFKVRVTDFWGLNSIGSGMTNGINSLPTPIDITSVTYDLESMTVTWEQSSDNDFVSYELLRSDYQFGIWPDPPVDTYSSVVVITDQSTTSHSLTEFDPTVENWFKIKVIDFWGLDSIGNGMTNEIDSPPPTSTIYSTDVDGSFIINWSQNSDDDFLSYTIYESQSENMSNQTELFTTTNNTITSYIVEGISENEIRFYQLVIEDIWGLVSYSNIININTWLTFIQTFGCSSWDRLYSVQQTSDGGYIMTGEIRTCENGVLLLKTDSQGNEQWSKTFWGETGHSVQQTSDGGYIITGEVTTTYNKVLLLKTDSQGNTEWQKQFGVTNGPDAGRSVQQTLDGGYVITGQTWDSDGIGGGSIEILVIKTNSQGNEQMSKTYNWDGSGYSIQQTSDGGFIITGVLGYFNILVMKVDTYLNLESTFNSWHLGNGFGHSVQQTSDGGYIITGDDYEDIVLIKTDSQGYEQWRKTLGGETGHSVQQTSDGGYIITGKRYGNIILIKTDSQGNEQWIQDFGNGTGYSVQETLDGGYIITGNDDGTILLIKTDSEGNIY